MAHLVEGEWKNFTFKMLTSDDFPALSEHLRRNFYVDEPVTKIVGSSAKTADDFDCLLTSALQHGLSFAVYDKASGRIAGARVTQCQRRRLPDEVEEEEPAFTSVEMPIIYSFVMKTGSLADLFELYGVDEYADLLFASVERDFRCQGLATEMYKRTLALLKERGFKVAKSVFTSPFTRIAAKKFGFEELGRCYFRDIRDGDGKLIRPDLDDEQFGALMVVKL